jgi:pilus assembly protein CpaB
MARHFGGSPVKGNARSKVLAIIIVALIVFMGLMVTLILNQKKKAAPVATADAAVREVSVLVPIQEIQAGTPLTENLFVIEAKPQMLVDDRTIREFSQINGYFAKTRIIKGHPLHADFITLTRPSSAISQGIPPGYRAVTVPIDKIRGVEGWARAGSKVDVYWSTTRQGTTSLAVIVENAQVLSTDRSVSPDSLPDAPVPGSVTLLVTAQDAKKLSLAIGTGTISLALKGDGPDTTSVPAGLTTVEDLFYGGARPQQAVQQEEPCDGTLVVDGKEFCVGRGGKLTEVKRKKK